MCFHWIKEPKFNDVCVLFKQSNFCSRIPEMHSKMPRFQTFPTYSRLCTSFFLPHLLQSVCHLIKILLKTLVKGNKSFTHIEHRAGAVGSLNPRPDPWILTFVSVGFSPLFFFLFTSAMVRIAVDTTPKCVAHNLSDMRRLRSVRHSFASPQKSRRNCRSYV